MHKNYYVQSCINEKQYCVVKMAGKLVFKLFSLLKGMEANELQDQPSWHLMRVLLRVDYSALLAYWLLLPNEHLQNDSIPVEDLQRSYLRGNLYLDHCENLLKTIEQDVIQLNSADLK